MIPINEITESDKVRFFSKTKRSDNGCLEWTAVTRSGYGQIKYNGSMVNAHRFSWVIHYGPIPEYMFVLHKCDNRLCVDHNHLYIGDYGDNMSDVLTRGEKKLGTQSRYTREDINSMKKMKAKGARNWAIAKRFGCSERHISTVLNRGLTHLKP